MEEDKSWLNYSSMDQQKFSICLSLFSLVSSLATQPLNVVMTRQQAGLGRHTDTSSNKKNGIINDIIKLHQLVGLKGLFRGWIPIAFIGLPSNVIYLNINESSREFFQKVLKSNLPHLNPIYIDGIQAASSSLLSNAISLVPYGMASYILVYVNNSN